MAYHSKKNDGKGTGGGTRSPEGPQGEFSRRMPSPERLARYDKPESIGAVSKHKLVQAEMKKLFGEKETEILERPSCFIIRLKNEQGRRIKRLILLPPHGFTANRIDETNPHPEARQARIEVLGAVRAGKRGFSTLRNCVKFAHFTKREIETAGDNYAKADPASELYREAVKSAKDRFFVVRENGFGFYHNLMNLSDEWMALVLEKELKPQKRVDIEPKLGALDSSQQKTFWELMGAIRTCGDGIFETRADIVDEVIAFDAGKVMPPLVEALNILENGKHEPCTVYAIILKVGKREPEKVSQYLKEALENNEAPAYYLEELVAKLGRR